MSCPAHDTGSRRTLPEQCDHLTPVEQAFAKAVADAGTCVPPGMGGGSLLFAADVSFARKHHPLQITAPRDGRALAVVGTRSAKAAAACVAAVKRNVTASFPGNTLLGITHAHSRYKLSLTASYPPDR